MFTEPKIEYRREQPYLGIRTQVTLEELGSGLVPQLHDEVLEWMEAQGITPSGLSFIRYNVINMEDKLDLDLGWPVAESLPGNERITPGVLPAGKYATLVYTGLENGIAGNAALIGWAEANGIQWDRWDDPKGDAFKSRYETLLTEPADEPDVTKWETEVAIKIAGE
jgi:effector-binding domain-containing protein